MGKDVIIACDFENKEQTLKFRFIICSIIKNALFMHIPNIIHLKTNCTGFSVF